MREKQYEKIIEVLTDKITNLEADNFYKDVVIENQKREIEQLNELLTPTAKGDLKDE